MSDPRTALGDEPVAWLKRQNRKDACTERAPVMTIKSIIRRRAFRDGFHDGRQSRPMRRHTTRRARWLYALGRIFANIAPTDMRIHEQCHVTEAVAAAFAAMPVRY
jgi:hypothetical protein